MRPLRIEPGQIAREEIATIWIKWKLGAGSVTGTLTLNPPDTVEEKSD